MCLLELVVVLLIIWSGKRTALSTNEELRPLCFIRSLRWLVQIISISIDPTYDTPQILKEYADEHHAIPGKWNFLSGSKEETFQLARCGFVLPALDGNGVPDDFVHSDKFILIDDQGRIRGYYSGTTREEVDLLMLETKILLHGKE